MARYLVCASNTAPAMACAGALSITIDSGLMDRMLWGFPGIRRRAFEAASRLMRSTKPDREPSRFAALQHVTDSGLAPSVGPGNHTPCCGPGTARGPGPSPDREASPAREKLFPNRTIFSKLRRVMTSDQRPV
jgi:hypothetical protein